MTSACILVGYVCIGRIVTFWINWMVGVGEQDKHWRVNYLHTAFWPIFLPFFAMALFVDLLDSIKGDGQ